MEPTSTSKIGIKWGLALGITGIVLSLFLYYSGIQDPTDLQSKKAIIISLMMYPILFAFFYFGIKDFKTSNQGLMTLGEGMITALFIGLISGVIASIYMYIFMTYLAPDMTGDMTEAIVQQTNQDGEIPDKAVESMENMLNLFMSPGAMAIQAMVYRIFSALIFGFISALILKNED